MLAGWPESGPFRFYGTADATPWFRSCSPRRRTERRPGPGTQAGGGLAGGRLDPAAGSSGTPPVRCRAPSCSRAGATRSTPRADADGGGYVRADGSNPAPPLADLDTQAVACAAGSRSLAATQRGRGRADALRGRAIRPLGPEVHGGRGRKNVPCPARVRNSAGCCGRTRSSPTPRARRGAAERAGHPHPTRPAHAGGDRPELRSGATTAGRCGRSTRGWVGRPARGGRVPRRSGCEPVCSPRSTSSAARTSCTRSRAAVPSRSRSPTAVQAWTVGARSALEHAWDGAVCSRPMSPPRWVAD